MTSAAALAAAQKSRGVTVDEPGQRVPASFPAAAQSYSEPPNDHDEEKQEEAGEGGKKTTRLLVGALLCAVLVLAVVFAYNTLGNDTPVPVATESAVPSVSDSNKTSEEPSESPTPEEVVKPKIADLTRLVPGRQDLNAETDGTLSNAIDGNPASLYKSFSYTTPNFGGLASNMVFVVQLEDPSTVSEVKLEGLNGSGGSFEIRVGETEELSDAKVVSSGSFTGPTVTVPVSDEDGADAKAQYVFLNVTELPRLSSGANASRPYGLQIGEFRVS